MVGWVVIDTKGQHIDESGICYSTTNQMPTINDWRIGVNGVESFNDTLDLLTPNTTYYVRAYATTNKGTGYGLTVRFTTNAPSSPILTTNGITSITATTAISGGNITNDGGLAVISRGVCWSTSKTPTVADSKSSNGAGTGLFTSSIVGLLPNTTYFVRAFATNSIGTSYGNICQFTTADKGITFNPALDYGTLIDVDGNVYKTINIGTQTWMAENLKTSKYRTGYPIPNVANNNWVSLSSGAWRYYDDLLVLNDTYGKLYNWYAVNNISNLAPAGWHVPSDNEWTTLINYLGGQGVAGVELKESGISNWLSPNTGATNSSGFTALPGGYIPGYSSTFYEMLTTGLYWTTTSSNANSAYCRRVFNNNIIVDRLGLSKESGCSVRCIKD